MVERAKTTAIDLEQFRTFAQAAEILNLPCFKLRRAAKQGLLPTYRLMNSRRYVKIADIIAAMPPN